jgi:hypothetical protein
MEGTQVNLANVLLSESTIWCHVIVEKLNLELFNFCTSSSYLWAHIVSLAPVELLSFSQWLLKFAVFWSSSVCVDLHNVKDVLLVPVWVKQIQCTPLLHVSRPILILSSQLHLGFPSDVFYKKLCMHFVFILCAYSTFSSNPAWVYHPKHRNGQFCKV